jgi:hypothetical protein
MNSHDGILTLENIMNPGYQIWIILAVLLIGTNDAWSRSREVLDSFSMTDEAKQSNKIILIAREIPPEKQEPPLSKEEKKRRDEQKAFEKKLDVEAAALKASQANAEAEKLRNIRESEQRAQDAGEEAKRKAAEEERKRKKAAWDARCVINPVMTDLQLEACKEVRRNPLPE